MEYSKLPAVLEKALIEWRGQQTRKRLSTSLNSFADYLGYSRPIVSLWLDGDRRPTQENAEILLPKLVELIGDEAYDAFGIPRPDPDLQILTRIWPHLSEEARHTLRQQGEKYVTENEQSSAQSRTLEKTA